ncbi:hypothetical protein SLEP1_g44701 [Rubroshorea leprosula]|uniref:Uncharacterized protein n=1 Tax=Rubroshorea leprosula TaxID=152421 RepID=A0AAV5LH28_9ROSI|nr:hypothetical protein SLEP1_g44701 [Rubroshorea leprosula]
MNMVHISLVSSPVAYKGVNPLHLCMHTVKSDSISKTQAHGKQDLYGLGARKIGVTSLPPLGCLPLARTLFKWHDKDCVSRIDTDAQQYKRKINASAAASLQNQLPGL